MVRRLLAFIAVIFLVGVLMITVHGSPMASALENPQSGSIGIEGKIPSAAPKVGATITTPTNGQSFTTSPVTVAGLCPKGLLVKVFSNNVFVGATQCTTGTYSLQVSLFSGRNDLVARVFDAFDQAGPDSNVVSVTFNDSQFNPLGGPLLTLTSAYAQRGANPGQLLTWPIILNGGTGPYALTIDWGDGKTSDLMSRQFAGTFDISHTYDSAGIYQITIRAVDKNGVTAFLQLIGVANGAVIDKTKDNPQNKEIIIRILWLPAAACIILVFIAFWLGKRYELASLRKHLERNR